MGQARKNSHSPNWIAWIGVLLILPVQGFYASTLTPKAAAQQTAPQMSVEELERRTRSITVKILSGDSEGSGILIRKEGQVYTVLTNQHVLSPGKDSRVQTPDGRTYQAKYVRNVNFKEKDLALLQFRTNAGYGVASLGNLSTVAVNERVFTAGFPFEAELSRSRGFVFRAGQVLQIPEQAFKQGYQIGYNNEIEKGMSGGPILNLRGQVVGINGIHGYPLWGNPYVYEDGSQPTPAERDLMSRYSWGIPIQTFALLAPQYTPKAAFPTVNPPIARTLPPIANEVNNKAQEITVRINVPNSPNCSGSGVIIAKQGNVYTVLTAEHVVREELNCNRTKLEVVTPDGQTHGVENNTVKTLQGADLAVLKFKKNGKNYQVATLARHNLEKKGGLVFVSGWPGSKPASGKTSLLFNAGILFNKEAGTLQAKDSLSLTYGYGLVYNNITKAGVSGGPVLDTRGYVIGIHGRADGEVAVEEAGARHTMQLGYSLGIPISTFLSKAQKEGIELKQLKIYSCEEQSLSLATQEIFKPRQKLYTCDPPPLTEEETTSTVKALLKVEKPGDTDAVAWLNYGNQLWRLSLYEEALAAFNQAIQFRSNFYQASYSRGLALLDHGKYEEALEAFDKAIQESKENFALAWRGRGLALTSLKRYPEEALRSFEKAIILNPKDFVVRIWQGNVLQMQGFHEDALKAYDEAIKIEPHPWAYNQRGIANHKLGKTKEAIADFNKAIEIVPDYADAYINRGNFQYEWGDKNKAMEDYNKAVVIAPNYALAYFSRGWLRYYHEGEQLGGITDLGLAIQNDPSNALFYYSLGRMFYNEKDNEEAIAYYNKAIQLNSTVGEAYYERGLAHRRIEDMRAALIDFQRAAEIYQQQKKQELSQQARARIEKLKRATLSLQAQVAIYEGVAQNITHEGQGKVSVEIFEIGNSSRKVKVWIAFSHGLFGEGEFEGVINDDNIIELSGSLDSEGFLNTNIRLKLLANESIEGSYLLKAGRYNLLARDQNGEFTARKVKEVSKATLLANRLKPENAEAYMKRGIAHYSQKNYPGASANYTAAIRLKPDYPEAYFQRGFARYLQGDHREAIKDFSEAVRLKPDWSEAYYSRGLLHAELKNYPGAIQDYTQVLRHSEFAGIGVRLVTKERIPGIIVAEVWENSPAKKGGVNVNDRILAVDGETTINKSDSELKQLLNDRILGKAGTQITLRLARQDRGEFNVTLVRTSVVNPRFAVVYYQRGLARTQLQGKQGAREDFQKAADLYQQQEDMDMHQTALGKLRELQR